MRLSLRKCREKRFLFPALTLLCLLLCGVIIKNRVRRSKNIKSTKEGQLINSADRPKSNKTIFVLPTLVMACKAQFLQRSMDSLRNFRPDAATFPIIVAPYCYSKETYEVLESFKWDFNITVLEIPKLAVGRQYKYALNHVFELLKHKAVIVLEDNLDISPDFFEYFLATYSLLEKDPSIWCVSAWNDNCKEGLVEATQHYLLHRTDYFPGMGWMLLSETWVQIKLSLPDEFTGDSLQDPTVTRGRVCIRPEISRTYEFGVYESSMAKLRPNHHPRNGQRLLNTLYVPFSRIDLSYLLKKEEFFFVNFVYSCPETTVDDVIMRNVNSTLKFVRIPYTNSTELRRVANTFGLMDDFRHGVPRTGLYGIVQCFINKRRVFLAPVRNLFKSITHKTPNKSVFRNISSSLT